MITPLPVSTMPKGAKKQPRGGSRKGCPNKVTASLKEMILGALNNAGGQRYLAEQAEKNPGPFLALIGKVLPSTLAISGPEGKDLKITFEIIRPQTVNKLPSDSLAKTGGKTPKAVSIK